MDVVSQNVRWLLPEGATPCDLFLHFRGKRALGLGKGQEISPAFLEKLAKANYAYVYVRSQDLSLWNDWRARRHPRHGDAKDSSTPEGENLYGNKRAELLSYAQKILHRRVDGEKALDHAMDAATATLKKVISQSVLDWYFNQFHEPPDLFYHCARVAYPLAIFCTLHALGHENEIEGIVLSAVIHELSGDPRESLKTIVSEQTLEYLERERQALPAHVVELVRQHDELFSGKGFPGNKQGSVIPELVRAFSLFNHFDHYRLAATGTRRARFEQAKQKMVARKADYDPKLWDKFWQFWENSVEAIA